MPYPNAFGPSIWDAWNESYPADAAGEVEHGAYYAGVQQPGWIGRRACGSAVDWQLGGLYEDRGLLTIGPDGLPLCCRRRRGAYSAAYSFGWDSLSAG